MTHRRRGTGATGGGSAAGGHRWIVVAVIVVALGSPAVAGAAARPLHAMPPRIADHAGACRYWVAPPPAGSDANDGSAADPWATMTHAASMVPDAGCAVVFRDGTYRGVAAVKRRFATTTTFRAEHAYGAVLEHSGTVLDIDGGRSMVFEGFEIRHADPDAAGYVAIVSSGNGERSEHITFRNIIFHDSFDNDLLKIHDASRHVTVAGSIFYNQGDSEQHIDVNSATDVVIADSVFFNDFAGSGRSSGGVTKHYIVVKDSNEGADGLLGSRRVTIRRNVFLHGKGEIEMFVKIGNDGKPYHEAREVRVENNIMVGVGDASTTSSFGVSGARDVSFVNNTVVGDLPSRAFAFRLDHKRENPRNVGIRVANNIFSDPTGSMGAFSGGRRESTTDLALESNLYWNGGAPIPPGSVATPAIDDPHPTVADPGLDPNRTTVTLPIWNGNDFASGARTIRDEFVSLVSAYGAVASGSSSMDRATDVGAPVDDVLGLWRGDLVDIGAFEAGAVEGPFNFIAGAIGPVWESFAYEMAAIPGRDTVASRPRSGFRRTARVSSFARRTRSLDESRALDGSR